MQERNEMSGSRGEANFVWKCKNCKRESSATIRVGPDAYKISEPPKLAKIIEFDCRGLEFTDFKPEVHMVHMHDNASRTTGMLTRAVSARRESGLPKELSLVPSSRASSWPRESGSTTMRIQVKKSALMTSNGKSSVRDSWEDRKACILTCPFHFLGRF